MADPVDPNVDYDAKRMMATKTGADAPSYDAMGNVTQPSSTFSGNTAQTVAPQWDTSVNNPAAAAQMTPAPTPMQSPNAQPTAAAGATAAAPPQTGLPSNVTPHANIPGVFEAKGPDGSVTYTDNPFGSFDGKGRYQLPTDNGQGNLPKDAATAAGIPQMLPTGQVNPAWIAKNSEMPTTGTFAERGMQMSANKNANVNFRTNSAQYAPRNTLTDVDAIGSDAAYKHRAADGTMVAGAPQLNSGMGGGVNPLQAADTLAQVNLRNTEAGQKVADFNAGRRDTINKGGEANIAARLEALKDDKSMSDAQKRQYVALEVAHDEISRGATPDQLSNAAHEGISTFLDQAGQSAQPMVGRGPAPGEVNPADVGVENTPLWKKILGGGSTQLAVRGPSGVETTSKLGNMTPVMSRFLANHGGDAQGITPFLNHFKQYGGVYGMPKSGQ